MKKIFNKERISDFLHLLLSPCLAATIGIYGWSSNEWFTPLIAITPIIWGTSRSKVQAFLTMFAYYLAASRGIVPGAYVFFQDGNTVRAVLLWLGSAAALSVPWAIFAISQKDNFLMCLIKTSGAVFLCAIPPLGFFGWVNPILSAAIFFPKLGLFGIAVMLLLWAFTLKFRSEKHILGLLFFEATACFAVSLFWYWGGIELPPKPQNFIGVNTEFGQLASGSSDPFAGYERMKAVFENLYERREKRKNDEAENIVLPETICGMFFSGKAMEIWESEARKFLGNDPKKTLFLGAEFLTEITENGIRYDNVVFSVGATSLQYAQRIPVPFSMYKPWTNAGANAYIFEPQAELYLENDRYHSRIGIVVCYEQFLVWNWVLMLAGNDWKAPDVVICTANNWWCRDTSLPAIQKRSRELWSRLFWVPMVSAENR